MLIYAFPCFIWVHKNIATRMETIIFKAYLAISVNQQRRGVVSIWGTPYTDFDKCFNLVSIDLDTQCNRFLVILYPHFFILTLLFPSIICQLAALETLPQGERGRRQKRSREKKKIRGKKRERGGGVGIKRIHIAKGWLGDKSATDSQLSKNKRQMYLFETIT